MIFLPYSGIFAHAMGHGLIDGNPATGVRKFPDQKRTRRLSRDEITQLGSALQEFEHVEHLVGIAIIRLLVDRRAKRAPLAG